jgi:hypothetical protein
MNNEIDKHVEAGVAVLGTHPCICLKTENIKVSVQILISVIKSKPGTYQMHKNYDIGSLFLLSSCM